MTKAQKLVFVKQIDNAMKAKWNFANIGQGAGDILVTTNPTFNDHSVAGVTKAEVEVLINAKITEKSTKFTPVQYIYQPANALIPVIEQGMYRRVKDPVDLGNDGPDTIQHNSLLGHWYIKTNTRVKIFDDSLTLIQSMTSAEAITPLIAGYTHRFIDGLKVYLWNPVTSLYELETQLPSSSPQVRGTFTDRGGKKGIGLQGASIKPFTISPAGAIVTGAEIARSYYWNISIDGKYLVYTGSTTGDLNVLERQADNTYLNILNVVQADMVKPTGAGTTQYQTPTITADGTVIFLGTQNSSSILVWNRLADGTYQQVAPLVAEPLKVSVYVHSTLAVSLDGTKLGVITRYGGNTYGRGMVVLELGEDTPVADSCIFTYSGGDTTMLIKAPNTVTTVTVETWKIVDGSTAAKGPNQDFTLVANQENTLQLGNEFPLATVLHIDGKTFTVGEVVDNADGNTKIYNIIPQTWFSLCDEAPNGGNEGEVTYSTGNLLLNGDLIYQESDTFIPSWAALETPSRYGGSKCRVSAVNAEGIQQTGLNLAPTIYTLTAKFSELKPAYPTGLADDICNILVKVTYTDDSTSILVLKVFIETNSSVVHDVTEVLDIDTNGKTIKDFSIYLSTTLQQGQYFDIDRITLRPKG